MPNHPYLDASVAWRIKHKNIQFREADYRTQAQAIQEAGLATEVHRMISASKDADVYLCSYHNAPLAVKLYRLYRTSHRGGTPIMLAPSKGHGAKTTARTPSARHGITPLC
jgi:RIO-like serine/threonine protein kinase